MVFDFRAYLAVAERLAASNDEAELRSAISRAYYAVFHRARDFVHAEGYCPGRARLDHREVWNALKRDPDPARAEIGERGDELHHLRRNADYDRQFAGNLTTSNRQIVDEARAVIEAIDRL